MEDLLISILEEFGYPVRLQGSFRPHEKYPASFFTFWNNSSYGSEKYNNTVEGSIIWNYSVNFYSDNPVIVNSKLMEAKKKLIENGWLVDGGGYSVMSDEPTHTGRGITATYRQESR